MVLITFIACTLLVAFLTFFITRKRDQSTSDGYFLAGRALTGGVIAGSLMLTNLSTEQLVGLNGSAFLNGLSVMAWEVVAVVALVLSAWFFLPRFLKSGIATVPQYLEERFNTTTRRITNVIFILSYSFILMPIILYSGAVGLNSILDFGAIVGISDPTAELWVMVWIIGIIGSIYAIFGGLSSVAISDSINGVGLLIGGVMISVFGLIALGGEDGGMLAGWEALRTEQPQMLNSISNRTEVAGNVPFSTLFSGVLLLNLFYWCTNQQIIQRTFGANSLKEGQKGVLFAGGLKLLGPIILVLPGLIAYAMWSRGDLAIPLGDDGLPKADKAYGTLVRSVMPGSGILAGFFAAVMIGAILSSFNSVLNSTCTLFSLGIYQGGIKKDATEKQVIRAGKIFGGVIAVIAICLAPTLAATESIFGFIQKASATYYIPLFSVVVVGMLSKRVPAIAANIGLGLGLVLMLLGLLVDPFIESVVDPLHFFHYIGIVCVALIAFMLIWGKVKPLETQWVQKDPKFVDMTPWKYTYPVGIVLLVLVFAVYMYFADFAVLSQ